MGSAEILWNRQDVERDKGYLPFDVAWGRPKYCGTFDMTKQLACPRNTSYDFESRGLFGSTVGVVKIQGGDK